MRKNKFGTLKRVAAGILAFVTVAASVTSPVLAYADEAYPELGAVKEYIEPDEEVKAEDIEIKAGDEFDVNKNFDKITYNKEKVSIKLHEAKADNGSDFDSKKAGTYKATYYVDPVSGNHSYRVTRKIIVKEAEPAPAEKASSSDTAAAADKQEDAEEAEDADSDSAAAAGAEEAAEAAEADTAAAAADTSAQEEAQAEPAADADTAALAATEAAPAAATEAAKEDGMTMDEFLPPMSDGEIATAYANLTAGNDSLDLDAAVNSTANLSNSLTVKKKYYVDYDNAYGGTDWHTAPIVIKDDNSGKEYSAVCLEPLIPGYDIGDKVYKVEAVTDSLMLKICYYGAFGYGKDYAKGINNKKDANIIITHVAAAYRFYQLGHARNYNYTSAAEGWQSGTSAKLRSDVMAYINKVKGLSVPSGFTVYVTTGLHEDGGWRQHYIFCIKDGYGEIIKKTDNSALAKNPRYSLGGTTVGIYKDATCKTLIKEVSLPDDGHTGTSKFGQKIELTPGTYYVKETASTDTYGNNKKVYELKITAGQTSSVTISDPPLMDLEPIIINKKNADGKTVTDLSNAVFEITYYDDFTCTNDVRTWYIATDASGRAVLDSGHIAKAAALGYKSGALYKDTASGSVGIPRGSISIKEVQAPEGMELDPHFSTKFNVDGDWNVRKYEGSEVKVSVAARPSGSSLMLRSDGTQLSEIFTVTDPEEPATGIVEIQKVDKNNGTTPSGDAVFKDAKYTIYNASGSAIVFKGKEIADGEAVAVLTTNAAGKASVSNLPEGTYKIKETAAPKGYKLSDEERTFTISKDVTKVSYTAASKKPFEEEPLYSKIKILKIDASKKPVPNVEFKVTLNSTGEERTYKTDKDGIFTSDELPYGKYTLTEISCEGNKGYILADPIEFEVTGTPDTIVIPDIINYKEPSFETLLTGSADSHVVKAGSEVTLTDKITYANLEAEIGKTYKFVGELHDKETGEIINVNGEDLVIEQEFKIENGSGTVSQSFTFDSEGFEGRSVVAFESLIDDKGKVILTHADINNAEQTVSFPGIETNAVSKDTGTKISKSLGTVSIDDEVTYTNVVPNKEYVLTGTLYYGNNGEAVTDKNGNVVTTTKTFTPKASEGKETLTFTFEASSAYAGKIVVAFEKLEQDGVEIAAHADLSDENQTVYPPMIRTTATDKTTGTHTGTASAEAVINDKVTYRNLVEGKTYDVEGTLHYVESGDPVLGADGKPVTATGKIAVPENDGTETDRTKGSVTLQFKFDATILKEKAVVAFETLKYEGVEVAVHADLKDTNQTVYYPEIKTTAVDKDTNTKTGVVSKNAVITDTVEYKGLTAGKEYVLKAAVADKATGELIEGVAAEKTFTADQADGTITIDIPIDSSKLAGKTIVAFETIYSENVEIAVHADINDKDQSVTYPSVKTTAKDAATGTHAGAATDEKTKITDTVVYTGLTKGKDYTVKGIVVNKADGSAIEGVTAEKTFTAEAADGSIDLEFEVESSKVAGKSVVVFESLYYEGIEIAVHADIKDKDQTVSYPGISTTAKDKVTGEQIGTISKETVIVDTVNCTGLIPGEEYTVKGKVMNKADGTEIAGAVAERTFTAGAETESIDLEFTIDSSKLEGKSVVVFESLYNNGIEIAVHADINDKDQTVSYPGVKTTATDSMTGDHVGTVSKKAVVYDKVDYTGLIAGREYTVSGTLHDKATGEAIEGAVAEQTFTADAAEGSVVIKFEVDSSVLAGKSVVAFETIKYNGKEVAIHADINDKDQTVSYPHVWTEASDVTTKDHVGIFFKTNRTDVIDQVHLENLVAGEEYELEGVLMDKESGQPVLDDKGNAVTLKTDKPFKADAENMVVELKCTVDTAWLKSESKTVVVYETLFHSDKDGNKVIVAKHENINDEDQSVHYPEVTTDAKDAATGEKAGQASETTTLIDVVTYKNLIADQDYTVSGKLYIQDGEKAGQPLVGKDGKEITASAELKAGGHGTDGTVELKFEFDSTLLEGEPVVVFEDLLHNGIKVATHSDINDEKQIVYYPTVCTNASDKLTSIQTGVVGGEAEVVDVVSYGKVKAGETYKAKGVLYDKETEEPLKDDADGNEIKAETEEFTAEAASGSVNVEFKLDSSLLAGKTVVAYQELYLIKEGKEILIAERKDINDAAESIYYPGVETNATDESTKTHVGELSKTQKIIDDVTYTNLVPDKEYTVSGVLMDKETGEFLPDADGNKIEAKTTFTPKEADGTVQLVYTLDSTLLAGKTVVVFEDLFYNNVKVASHADIEDENQTVYYPEISTQAADELTKTQVGSVNKKDVVTDIVTYSNIVKGEKYKAVGMLIDKSTGKAVKDSKDKVITGSESFTAEDTKGSVEVKFTLDSSELAGKTLVAYQYLYIVKDGKDVLVAAHTDINDAAEAIYYPGVTTDAVDGETGNHTGTVTKTAVVKDKVTYTNLIPGRKYTVDGTLMVKETGKALLDAKGEAVTATETFTAQKADGEITLTFKFDSSLLEGKTVVAFEDLSHEGITVAFHKDINDEDQSVHYPKVSTKASIKSGSSKASTTAEASGTVTVIDNVTYENLIPGQQYTVEGTLMDKSTGKAFTVNNKTITSKKTFTAQSANGTVELKFTFNGKGLGSKTLVVFEDLYSNGKKVASHADINDKAQTVKLTPPPENPPKNNPPKKTASKPKTGDNSMLYGWAVLAVVAAVTAAVVIRKRKKG